MEEPRPLYAPPNSWPPKHNITAEDVRLAHKINRFIEAVLDEDFLRQLDTIFQEKARQELEQLYGWSWGLDRSSRFGKEPKELQEGLVHDYPIRKKGDEIVPGVVQWVHGSNDALRYRGNELMREKIWLQDGMPDEKGYAYYYYTGVQWEVVPAQTDWAQCPEVASVTNNLKLFNERVGAKPSNQAIITRYKNQDFGIGAHFDKPKSIAPSDKDGTSLITVIKMGEVGRKFNIYDLEENLLWGEVVAPGDAIVMTLEANLKTKHEVPIEKDSAIGDSGSIVFRSISSIVPFEEVMKKREASRKQKRKARDEKEQRKEAAVAAAKVSKEGGKYKVSIVPSSVSGDVPDVPVVKVARVQ